MSSREIKTYTYSDIVSQEAHITALEAKSIELANRVQDYRTGDLRRIAALVDCREIDREVERAYQDLETMRIGLRS